MALIAVLYTEQDREYAQTLTDMLMRQSFEAVLISRADADLATGYYKIVSAAALIVIGSPTLADWPQLLDSAMPKKPTFVIDYRRGEIWSPPDRKLMTYEVDDLLPSEFFQRLAGIVPRHYPPYASTDAPHTVVAPPQATAAPPPSRPSSPLLIPVGIAAAVVSAVGSLISGAVRSVEAGLKQREAPTQSVSREAAPTPPPDDQKAVDASASLSAPVQPKVDEETEMTRGIVDDLVRDAPGAIAPSTETSASSTTDEVHFTAFRPKEIAVETEYTLLVYAHVESMLEAVRTNAQKFRDEMGGAARESRNTDAIRLPRGTEITIVPTCEGVTFNPERITFRWMGNWQRADFRFSADKSLAGTEDVALIEIFSGPLMIGRIKMAMAFDAVPPSTPNPIPDVPFTASMYRRDQIFVSYSHADTTIAVRFRNSCKALGFDVLIDIDTLRAGEVWNDALMRLIEQADIFQLFWSERAAQSDYVRQEWQYARELQKKKAKPADFIRPVHWESPKPVPAPPAELSDLHFAYVPLAE